MENHPISLELLSPAANADIAIEAILHGADAVYIGPPSHGARKKASNSIADIKRVVDFAHIYRAKVYVTVNTVIYDNELKEVEGMIWDLWRIGVDAIIVQDMGILRLDLPPIALHASTQCDTRTVGKARFLEEVGFSQIVLARELTLSEIGEICRSVSVPVECFVHGALCVSYSGVCHASQACKGRSANRGECAQMCRLPYSLLDAKGNKVITDRHLLSLRDLNLSDRLDRLAEAGVRSFKIEGRLKEMSYVKNVTTRYSEVIDRFIKDNPGKYVRASAGRSIVDFDARLDKSFNRGFTHYFLDNRRTTDIYEPRTPKSLGEIVKDKGALSPGDGISWFDRKGNYEGMQVNRISGKSIFGPNGKVITLDRPIYRTSDIKWNSELSKKTAVRKIDIEVELDEKGVSARDERGNRIRIGLILKIEKSEKNPDIERFFAKLGNTPYSLKSFTNNLPPNAFVPASRLTEIRRQVVNHLSEANAATYHAERRREENMEAVFEEKHLSYRHNVANSLAAAFYKSHGVETIEKAGELMKQSDLIKRRLMTTRHCILRELGHCKKESAKFRSQNEMYLENGNIRLRLEFDCKNCEMHVYGCGE